MDIRSKISSDDVALFEMSCYFLLCAVYLPTLLYYTGFGDASPKFPASVSHVIREGVPRCANILMFFLAGLTLQIPVYRIGDIRIYF